MSCQTRWRKSFRKNSRHCGRNRCRCPDSGRCSDSSTLRLDGGDGALLRLTRRSTQHRHPTFARGPVACHRFVVYEVQHHWSATQTLPARNSQVPLPAIEWKKNCQERIGCSPSVRRTWFSLRIPCVSRRTVPRSWPWGSTPAAEFAAKTVTSPHHLGGVRGDSSVALHALVCVVSEMGMKIYLCARCLSHLWLLCTVSAART